jgi:hypothetical protein
MEPYLRYIICPRGVVLNYGQKMLSLFTCKINNFIRRLSNVSEKAMFSTQSIQFRHVYIATTAQSYKFHFTVTALLARHQQ